MRKGERERKGEKGREGERKGGGGGQLLLIKIVHTKKMERGGEGRRTHPCDTNLKFFVLILTNHVLMINQIMHETNVQLIDVHRPYQLQVQILSMEDVRCMPVREEERKKKKKKKKKRKKKKKKEDFQVRD